MENALRHLPSGQRLNRKQVCALLHWSRTTLWRREQAGLRFVEGEISADELRGWVVRYKRAVAVGA